MHILKDNKTKIKLVNLVNRKMSIYQLNAKASRRKKMFNLKQILMQLKAGKIENNK
jgi:hypothetical protein